MLSQKYFFLLTGFLLTLVALSHLVRALMGWEMIIAGSEVPMAVSWFAFIITGCLACHAWKFGGQCPKK